MFLQRLFLLFFSRTLLSIKACCCMQWIPTPIFLVSALRYLLLGSSILQFSAMSKIHTLSLRVHLTLRFLNSWCILPVIYICMYGQAPAFVILTSETLSIRSLGSLKGSRLCLFLCHPLPLPEIFFWGSKPWISSSSQRILLLRGFLSQICFLSMPF